MVSSAYRYSSSTAFRNSALISALNLAVHRCGFSSLIVIDQVDAEIAVHRLVAQDVLVLLGGAGHLVLPAEREDLREPDVEEEAFHQAGEDDQRLEQLLVVLRRAGVEVGIHDRVDERDQELVLVADRRDLVVGVEDLAFVQTERLDDVLIGVRVDRFFESLAQQELTALGRRDVPVGAEHDVVGGERIGGHEEAEVALDDAALVFGKSRSDPSTSRCRATCSLLAASSGWRRSRGTSPTPTCT